VTSAWVFLCAQDGGGALVRHVDEPLDASAKVACLSPTLVVDVTLGVVELRTIGASAELTTEEHVCDAFGLQGSR
jgi:hypothetical protein